MRQENSLQFGADELKSLTDTAYQKLRQAIVDGRIPPGTRFTDRDLAEQMRVSTTTVKRALNRLSLEGLVDIRPRRGTYVSDAFSQRMEENMIIRAYLEGLAARFAAQKANEQDLQALQEQVEVMRRSTQKGQVQEMAAANARFHSLIREAGKNPYVHRMIDVIRSFDSDFRGRSLADLEEARRGLDEHAGVFEAIKARDGDLAEERMKSHIIRTLRSVLEKRGATSESRPAPEDQNVESLSGAE